MLNQARQHQAAGKWKDAEVSLQNAKVALDAQPALHADEMHDEIRDELIKVRQELEKGQQHRQTAQNQYQAFQKPYDDALFFVTQLTGFNLAESRDKAGDAARKALAIYGLGDGSAANVLLDKLEQSRRFHSAVEFSRLVAKCFELLLIWAETEAGSAVRDEQSRQRGQRGVHIGHGSEVGGSSWSRFTDFSGAQGKLPRSEQGRIGCGDHG